MMHAEYCQSQGGRAYLAGHGLDRNPYAAGQTDGPADWWREGWGQQWQHAGCPDLGKMAFTSEDVLFLLRVHKLGEIKAASVWAEIVESVKATGAVFAEVFRVFRDTVLKSNEGITDASESNGDDGGRAAGGDLPRGRRVPGNHRGREPDGHLPGVHTGA